MNISLSGACIHGGRDAKIGRLWKDVVVYLKANKTSGQDALHGKIMWVDNSNSMGIKFKEDEDSRKLIERYILEKSLSMNKVKK